MRKIKIYYFVFTLCFLLSANSQPIIRTYTTNNDGIPVGYQKHRKIVFNDKTFVFYGDSIVNMFNIPLFIMKLNPVGDVVWIKKYYYPGFASGDFDVLQGNGSLFVIKPDLINPQILALDTTSGNLQFFKQYGGIQIGSDGCTIAGGKFLITGTQNTAPNNKLLAEINLSNGNVIQCYDLTAGITSGLKLNTITINRLTNNKVLITGICYNTLSDIGARYFASLDASSLTFGAFVHVLSKIDLNNLPQYGISNYSGNNRSYTLLNYNDYIPKSHLIIKADTLFGLTLKSYKALAIPNASYWGALHYNSLNTFGDKLIFTDLYNTQSTQENSQPCLIRLDTSFAFVDKIILPTFRMYNSFGSKNIDVKTTSNALIITYKSNDSLVYNDSQVYNKLWYYHNYYNWVANTCTGYSAMPTFTTKILSDSVVFSMATNIPYSITYSNVTTPTIQASSINSRPPLCFNIYVSVKDINYLKGLRSIEVEYNKFEISSLNTTIHDIAIFSIQGTKLFEAKNINNEKANVDLNIYPPGLYIIKCTLASSDERVIKLISH